MTEEKNGCPECETTDYFQDCLEYRVFVYSTDKYGNVNKIWHITRCYFCGELFDGTIHNRESADFIKLLPYAESNADDFLEGESNG